MLEQKYSEVDLARLAAFIDGEGCIFIKPRSSRRSGGYHLLITVINTDPRLGAWLHKTFGGAFKIRSQRKAKPHHKDSYRWQVSSQQAHDLLKACYPYLIIKREQAEVAFAFQSTLRGPGVPLSNETVKLRDQLAKDISDLKWKTFEDESFQLTEPDNPALFN